MQLPNLLIKLTGVLREKLQSLRDQARVALVDVRRAGRRFVVARDPPPPHPLLFCLALFFVTAGGPPAGRVLRAVYC